MVSMIMDHFKDKWQGLPSFSIPSLSIPAVPAITPEEIQEFRKLLDRAREWDRKNNQPDCGLEEKKEAVKKIAQALGVEIDFL